MAGELTEELVGELRYRIADLDAARWDDDALYAALNVAQARAAEDLNDGALWFLAAMDDVNLVAATQEYALPTNLLRHRIVGYKDRWAQQWPLWQLTSCDADEGDPAYVLWNGQVRFLNPVTADPGDQYWLYYLRNPTDVDATHDPLWPRQYWLLLQEHAAATLFASDALLQDVAERATQRYQELVAVINGVYSTSRADENVPVDARRRA